MSLDEMESAWRGQPRPALDHEEALRHLDRTRRTANRGVAAAATVLLLMLANLGLKVYRLATSDAFALVNSFWDLVIAAAVVASGALGLHYALHFRRELQALGQNTTACLDLLIRSVRREIRSLRRDLPIALGGFLGLIVLAKAQFIGAGLESHEEWSLVVLVAALMLILTVGMQLRVTAFLRPRLNALLATHRDLAEGQPSATRVAARPPT